MRAGFACSVVSCPPTDLLCLCGLLVASGSVDRSGLPSEGRTPECTPTAPTRSARGVPPTPTAPIYALRCANCADAASALVRLLVLAGTAGELPGLRTALQDRKQSDPSLPRLRTSTSLRAAYPSACSLSLPTARFQCSLDHAAAPHPLAPPRSPRTLPIEGNAVHHCSEATPYHTQLRATVQEEGLRGGRSLH